MIADLDIINKIMIWLVKFVVKDVNLAQILVQKIA